MTQEPGAVLSPTSRFERHQVAPGVTLHLAPSRKFKTALVKVLVRTDLAAETATEVAVLPYLLRHGTTRVPSMRAVNRELEALYGTTLGLDVLKAGEAQVLSLRLDVLGDRHLPPGGGDVLARAVALLRDLVLDPALDGGAFPGRAVDQERETLRRFIEGLVNDRPAYAAERCVRLACEGEPYAVFEYGALADLSALDGARLEARRRALLASAPIDVYALGAIDAPRARDLLAQAFALDRPPPPPLRGTTGHPAPRPARELREAAPVSQARLVMVLRAGPGPAAPGDATWALVVLNGVLGGFPHSKLFKNVRERAALCYDAGSSLERHKGLLLVQAGIEPGRFEQARDLCLAQVDAIARGDVSEHELQSTLEAYRQGYRAVLDAPARLAGHDYTMRLLGAPPEPDAAVAALERVDVAALADAARALRLDTVYLLGPQGGAS